MRQMLLIYINTLAEIVLCFEDMNEPLCSTKGPKIKGLWMWVYKMFQCYGFVLFSAVLLHFFGKYSSFVCPLAAISFHPFKGDEVDPLFWS